MHITETHTAAKVTLWLEATVPAILRAPVANPLGRERKAPIRALWTIPAFISALIVKQSDVCTTLITNAWQIMLISEAVMPRMPKLQSVILSKKNEINLMKRATQAIVSACVALLLWIRITRMNR